MAATKTTKTENVPVTLAEISFWEQVYLEAFSPSFSVSVKAADKEARKYADRALLSRRKQFGPR